MSSRFPSSTATATDVDLASLGVLSDVVPGLFFAVDHDAATADVAPWPPDVVHPDDEAGLRAAWDAVRAGRGPFAGRARIRDSGEGYRPFDLRGAPVLDRRGRVITWIVAKTAATAPETATGCELADLQRAVRAERDMYATMAAVVPGAFASFRARPDGEIEIPYATASIVDLFGATPDELRANPSIPQERTHRDDRERVEAALLRSATDLTPFRCEYRLMHPGKGEIWIEVVSGPVREPGGATLWHGIVLDVTERKRVEHALRASGELLAGVAATSPGAIHSFRLDPDGSTSFPYLSTAFPDLYGVDPDAVRHDARVATDLIHEADVQRVNESILRSAESMSPWHCEYRVHHPTRGIVWLEGQSMPVRDAGGATTWHGVLIDVSARKRAEDADRAEHDRFTTISETVPGALYTFRARPDGSPDFPYISGTVVEICGLTAEEVRLAPERAFERIHPDDIARVLASIEELNIVPNAWRQEFRILHPERGEIWVEGHSRPVREPDGGVVWHGILMDLTERRRSEAKLRASEATLRAVVETVPDFLILIGRDGAIQFINRLLPGYDREEVVGAPALAFLAAGVREGTARTIERAFATGTVQTYEAAVPEAPGASAAGELRWFNTRVGPVVHDGEVIAVTLASTDMTEQKRAEIALRVSEARYRSLVELLPDAVFVHLDDRITFCIDAFARLLGASQEELLGRSPFDVLHPEDHATVRAWIEHLLAHDEPAPAVEMTVVRLDGQRRRVSGVAAPLVDREERGILVVLHDLTARQRTENLLGSVLESVEDAILTIDAAGTIRSCNPATTRIFGYAAEEIIARKISVLMPEPFRTKHDRYLAQYVGSGAVRPIPRGREVFGLRKDGTTFPIELSVTGFRLDGTQHFTGVIRDITERKKLEEQFRQAHKMEAFGQLAGGVAHDFNNLLTVILGESAQLVSVLPAGDPAIASLSEIHEAGQRAAGLTRQLLAFSRKSVLEPKVLDVNQVIRETEKLLVRLIGEDIHLSTDLAVGLSTVHVDPGQLGQVLMNLAVNARDAMPKGGELSIATTDVALVEPKAQSLGIAPGPYVQLCIRDSGTGMSDEVRARVFQPFFTTKGVGRGTGLGLAVVHGIVAQSGGAIDLETEVGRGTLWRVFLPAAAGAAPGRAASTPAASLSAQATILVVEDDDAVRRLANRLLTAKGYKVITARHGAEALVILGREPAKIDLVVTDVVMPVLDGRELAEQLRERFPSIKVLYVSGYTDDVLVRRGLLSEQVDFLQKPYTVASLAAAVGQTLARS